MIINGKKITTADSIDVLNPFDNSLVGRVSQGNATHVEAAIETASKGYDIMRRLPAHQRSRILSQTADLIEKQKEDFALLLAKEVGKPLAEARVEVSRCVNTYRLGAEDALRLRGQTIPFDAAPGAENKMGYYKRVPLGIVGAITPYNYPLNLAAHKISPAIACGNSVILKPATVTPLADIKMVEVMLEAGCPPEAISVITGDGRTVGMALVKDPRTRMISFTGSFDVGDRIMKAGGMKKYVMELGSNSAVIIMPDADLDLAVDRVAMGAYVAAGQACISVQRLIVSKEISEIFKTKLVDKVKTIRVGDPLDESTCMGPMISEDEAIRAQQWIEEAQQLGADVLLPIKRKGAVLYPTILDRVTPEMKVFSEEAFAPLSGIIEFKTLEQAIILANQSRYGLQGGIFTKDIDTALYAAEHVDVGGFMINEIPTFRVDLMPYGGVKDSGIGREGLQQAIEEMSDIKLICFNTSK